MVEQHRHFLGTCGLELEEVTSFETLWSSGSAPGVDAAAGDLSENDALQSLARKRGSKARAT